jgi:hypothetical protein
VRVDHDQPGAGLHLSDDEFWHGLRAMSSLRFGAARQDLLGELMRAATPRAPRQSQAGRTRLLAFVETMRLRGARARSAPWPGKLGVTLAFAAAAATAAAMLGGLRVGEPARLLAGDATSLGWRVENGTASARGYVSVPLAAPSARLVFDDGGDVGLAPGSRGRIAETTTASAKVVLEDGRARVHVPSTEPPRWLVDAGPFAARANGADMVVAWSADAETLDLWVGSGRVEVTGPMVGEGLRLSAGQHVRARVRDGAVRIDRQPESAEAMPAPCVSKASFPLSAAPSPDPGSDPCAAR